MRTNLDYSMKWMRSIHSLGALSRREPCRPQSVAPGRRVMAVDGVVWSAPDTPENREQLAYRLRS